MTQEVHLKILASDLAKFRTVLHAREDARKLWLAGSVAWKMNCFQNKKLKTHMTDYLINPAFEHPAHRERHQEKELCYVHRGQGLVITRVEHF